jgi:hypothetical protein
MTIMIIDLERAGIFMMYWKDVREMKSKWRVTEWKAQRKFRPPEPGAVENYHAVPLK